MPKVKVDHSIVDGRINAMWKEEDNEELLFEEMFWENYHIPGDEVYEGVSDTNDYEHKQQTYTEGGH